MEVPRHWRLKEHSLNPCRNGFRPSPPVNPPEDTLTRQVFVENPEVYANHEVRPYSQMMRPEVDQEVQPLEKPAESHIQIEIKIPSGIIYQDSAVPV